MIVWQVTWRVLFWTFLGIYWILIWFLINAQVGGRTWTPFNPLPPLKGTP